MGRNGEKISSSLVEWSHGFHGILLHLTGERLSETFGVESLVGIPAELSEPELNKTAKVS
jgi:hypothetical protein